MNKDKFAIEFAQYIAEEHFRLVNVHNGFYEWADEYTTLETEDLLRRFKKTL
jgi:hypothetical protein